MDQLFPRILRKLRLTESRSIHFPFSKRDFHFFLILLLLSFGLRVFNFRVPEEVTFDETHFGGFINNYLTGTFYFDIHPPLAKLILYFSAKLIGYDGSINFADRFAPTVHPFYCWLRWIPAFYGSFVGPFIFLALRVADVSFPLSSIGGLMASFDLCLICEARYLLSDSLLHFFTALAIYSTFSIEIYAIEKWQWWATLAFSSISCGCVISCKHTALGVIAFCIISHFLATVRNHRGVIDILTIREFLTRLTILGTFIATVYYSSFALHFKFLKKWAPDAVYMTETFEQTLLQNNQTEPIQKMGLFRKFVEYNVLMLENNMKIDGFHPYGSKWWTWPLMLSHGTLFWEDRDRHVWSMGNPFVWIASTFGIIAALFRITAGMENSMRLVTVVSGWMISYLPFALIPRATWSYHYLIPLLFAIVALILVIDGIQVGNVQRWLRGGLIVGTIVGFVWIGPGVYGIPIQKVERLLPFEVWRSANLPEEI